MEWQPIETAPKANTNCPEIEVVLAYWPGGHTESAYWSNGWWPTSYAAEDPWGDPTHWMPLPDPPK